MVNFLLDYTVISKKAELCRDCDKGHERGEFQHPKSFRSKIIGHGWMPVINEVHKESFSSTVN
jgi:hypothetical protein